MLVWVLIIAYDVKYQTSPKEEEANLSLAAATYHQLFSENYFDFDGGAV